MPGRSLTLFESAIKSPESRKIYMYSLNEFMKFIKIKNYDKVPKLNSKTIQTHLENWVLHLRDKGLKSHTIRGKLSAVELFLEMNKILYYKKIVRKLIPSSDYIPGGEKPFTTDDIQKFLKSTTRLRAKALAELDVEDGDIEKAFSILTEYKARSGGIWADVKKLRSIFDKTSYDEFVLAVEDPEKFDLLEEIIEKTIKMRDEIILLRTRKGMT